LVTAYPYERHPYDNTAIIEAAARAIYENDYIDNEPVPDHWVELAQEDPPFADYYRKQARAVLAAVTPLIRAAVLEEAAKELDMRAIKPDASCDQFSQGRNHGLQLASKVVRALKEQP